MGQSVGGLFSKDSGSTNDDGSYDPSTGQKLAHGILGGLQQGASAYDQQQARMKNGGGSPISAPQAPNVDFSKISNPMSGNPPTDPYAMWRQKYGNNNMLIGG